MILVAACIDKETKETETNNQQVEPCGDCAVAIVKSFDNKNAVKLPSDITIQGDEISETILTTQNLAKDTTIPPRSEAPITVYTAEDSTLMINSLPPKQTKSADEWRGV